jgi:3,4-dihydroxy 2-butanone 4-phosphate synthase/GTP cyclohydrolase II
VDLAVLAGLPPTAAICQVLSDTGAPSTGEELVRFCREHRLRAVRVADLLAYRRRREEAVLRVAETTLPTRAGTFRAIGYQSVVEGGEHLAMVCGEPAGLEHVPVRIQRHCVAGEVFHSLSCRCYENLEASLSTIQAGGLGVIVHLAALHEHGRSEHAPWDAEPSCSLDLACRRQENALASRILKDLGVGSVALLCAADERPRRLAPHGIRVDKDAIPLTRTVPDRFAMGGG